MRRQEKEIADRTEIESIIAEASVAHVAMCDGATPYVVPMSFGYEGGAFYFHCAREGRKVDILRSNNRVCIELETDVTTTRGDRACNWGKTYRSVIADGRAEFLSDDSERRHGLDVIMAHFADDRFEYLDDNVARLEIIRVRADSLSGKKS